MSEEEAQKLTALLTVDARAKVALLPAGEQTRFLELVAQQVKAKDRRANGAKVAADVRALDRIRRKARRWEASHPRASLRTRQRFARTVTSRAATTVAHPRERRATSERRAFSRVRAPDEPRPRKPAWPSDRLAPRWS